MIEDVEVGFMIACFLVLIALAIHHFKPDLKIL